MPSENNYKQILDVLHEVGAIKHSRVYVQPQTPYSTFHPFKAEFWEVNNHGLIVCRYPDDTIGLYQFVGNDNDPIENDIAFVRSLQHKNKEEKN